MGLPVFFSQGQLAFQRWGPLGSQSHGYRVITPGMAGVQPYPLISQPENGQGRALEALRGGIRSAAAAAIRVPHSGLQGCTPVGVLCRGCFVLSFFSETFADEADGGRPGDVCEGLGEGPGASGKWPWW